MAVVAVVMLAIGIVSVVERDRPTYWGTFTEQQTDCPRFPGRFGTCTYTGRWVSDDGTRVLENVKLDGDVGPGESVRAAYQPGGLMGDDENNIVHTEAWLGAGIWLPFVAVGVIALVTWLQHREWRHQRL